MLLEFFSQNQINFSDPFDFSRWRVKAIWYTYSSTGHAHISHFKPNNFFWQMLCLKSLFVLSFFTINTTHIYVLFSVAMTLVIQKLWLAMHVQTLSDPTVSHICRVRCMRSVISNISTAHKIRRLWKVTRHSSILNCRVLKSSDSGPTQTRLRVFESEWIVVRKTAGSTNEIHFIYNFIQPQPSILRMRFSIKIKLLYSRIIQVECDALKLLTLTLLKKKKFWNSDNQEVNVGRKKTSKS